MKLRVALTGASGFIGSAVAAEFIARGHEVAILTRPRSDLSRLADLARMHVVESLSLAAGAAGEALSTFQPDSFVHCAWRGVGGGERNASWQLTDNLRLTLDALECAKKSGCVYWLSLGSQAEYGNANRRLTESSPTHPTTCYGVAKLFAGELAHAYCRAENLQSAVLRVFSTYGPGDSPAWFIPYVTREFLAGRSPSLTFCEQRWDYLYVADAAAAVVRATEARIGGTFNLGSGSAVPLRDVVELVRRELSTDLLANYGAVPYRPDQVMHLEADISRLHVASGWAPSISLDVGLQRTVAFEKERFRQT